MDAGKTDLRPEATNPRHFIEDMRMDHVLFEMNGVPVHISAYMPWWNLPGEEKDRDDVFRFVTFGYFCGGGRHDQFHKGWDEVEAKVERGLKPNVAFNVGSLVERDSTVLAYPSLEPHVTPLGEFSRYAFTVDYTFNTPVKKAPDRKYAALLVASGLPLKNKFLARHVKPLAWVCPNVNAKDEDNLNPAYRNDHTLTYDELPQLFVECGCGLALSRVEGSNRAVFEYVLSGLPVVAIPEMGGRSSFLDNWNSIIVDIDFDDLKGNGNADAVRRAVDSLIERDPDPGEIRRRCLRRVKWIAYAMFRHLNRHFGWDFSMDAYMDAMRERRPGIVAKMEAVGDPLPLYDKSYSNVMRMPPDKGPRAFPVKIPEKNLPSHAMVSLTTGKWAPASVIRKMTERKIIRPRYERIAPAGAYMRVLGMKRSGNHAVINWLAGHYPEGVCFQNNATSTGPFPRDFRDPGKLPVYKECGIPVRRLSQPKGLLLSSYEDMPPDDIFPPRPGRYYAEHNYAFTYKHILILRDPFNAFASRYRREKQESKGYWFDYCVASGKSKKGCDLAALWKEHAKRFLDGPLYEVHVNYNEWCVSSEYRRLLEDQLEVGQSDAGFRSIPIIGGGSSFEPQGTQKINDPTVLFTRWRVYEDDPDFRRMFEDEELWYLSTQIFGHIPGTETFKTRLL